MSTVEKSTQSISVLSPGPQPEIRWCVWLAKKWPGQKVPKGHMIHPLSWESKSVAVPLTVGHLGRGPSCSVGRCHWSRIGLFNHVHTPGLSFSRCTTKNMKGQKYNRNQSIPAVERENDVWMPVQSCFWSRSVVHSAVQKRKMSVTARRT